MSNVRKRISELTALTSASLDTVVVGVDNGTTYKIELDVLADAVTSRVNILDRTRLSSLESVTSSFETKGRSVISSSAQISALGFTSSSVNLSSLNDFTSSQTTLNTAFTNGINSRLTTSSFETFSQSVDSRIIAATNEQSLTHLVNTSSFNQYTASISTGSLVDRLNTIENVSGSWITESETGSFLISLPNGILSGSVSYLDLTNIPNGIVSQSTDLSSLNLFTESLDGRVTSLENSTGSYLTSLPSDIVSGSSQLTSSFDERYTLSGSVQPLPNNVISGSSQLTSSFDARYALSSSLSSISSSFNSRFDGLVTTGSNTFSGSQVFSGSMTVTSGQVIASTITNNSSSLYLTSGSNLYVQNNGIVEITGSLFVSGSTTFKNTISVGTGSGVEGGEINLAYASSGNTTLTGSSLIVDVYGDKLRIFENGGNYRGAYIDISTLSNGVGTDIGNLTYFLEAYSTASYTLPGSYSVDTCRYSVVNTNVNVPNSWFDTSTYRFTPQKAGYWEIIASYDVYRNSEATLSIYKNGTGVAQIGAISAVNLIVTKIVYLNGSTDYITIGNNGFNSNSRTQTQEKSFFQAKFLSQ